MLLSRRPLRHITRMILAVWLFALGAGVANACLLNSPDHGSETSFSAASSSTSLAHTHQKEPPDPGTAGCFKFCDEPALAIKKLEPPIGDGGAGMVGTLPRALAPAVTSATANRPLVLSHRPAHLALPIAARPHRLTL
ncbi:hypothetical protein J2W49_002090 [Hydrogenophaga palleronii]|uniref:Uncharacterized protein n=1 Tax=Hydrogenophaga palleronii TaxID=65655 RepID=A0ABU1WLF6_9BURK|nr:hypothetical protein [Hydrogenophaga palleronii]MDR7150132.1 hypothetical protein [Hydrogenophaga palleronii]